jgi:hypothetical protein
VQASFATFGLFGLVGIIFFCTGGYFAYWLQGRAAAARNELGGPDVASNPDFAVESTRVLAVPGFPPKVFVQVATADGELCSFHMGTMQGHKFSDDLLRGVAAAMKKPAATEPQKEAG